MCLSQHFYVHKSVGLCVCVHVCFCACVIWLLSLSEHLLSPPLSLLLPFFPTLQQFAHTHTHTHTAGYLPCCHVANIVRWIQHTPAIHTLSHPKHNHRTKPPPLSTISFIFYSCANFFHPLFPVFPPSAFLLHSSIPPSLITLIRSSRWTSSSLLGRRLGLGDAIRLICIGKVNCRSGAGVWQ